MQTKKHINITIDKPLAIKLEIVGRMLNKNISALINDLIAKGLTEEAIIKECQLAQAQKLIAEAQLKLLNNSTGE